MLISQLCSGTLVQNSDKVTEATESLMWRFAVIRLEHAVFWSITVSHVFNLHPTPSMQTFKHEQIDKKLHLKLKSELFKVNASLKCVSLYAHYDPQNNQTCII